MFLPIVARGWWLILTLVLASGAAVAAEVPASEADTAGIALVPIEVSSGVDVKREDLESAVMKGLAVAGRPVVNPEDAAARVAQGKGELACQSAQCWNRLGVLTRAGYLVSGSVAREGKNFRVQFRLVHASDGSTVSSEDNQCEVGDCSVAELARRSARELVRQTLGRASADERKQPADPVLPGVPAVAVPPPPAVQATPEPLPQQSVQHRWVWPVLAGVSAAGIAAGAWFIAADNTAIPGLGGKQFDHGLAWGLTAIGAGVALGGVSTYYIFKESAEQSTQVALRIGPGSLSLAGRF
jgi:hypothetical protein